jgi:hypothetical protein
MPNQVCRKLAHSGLVDRRRSTRGLFAAAVSTRDTGRVSTSHTLSGRPAAILHLRLWVSRTAGRTDQPKCTSPEGSCHTSSVSHTRRLRMGPRQRSGHQRSSEAGQAGTAQRADVPACDDRRPRSCRLARWQGHGGAAARGSAGLRAGRATAARRHACYTLSSSRLAPGLEHGQVAIRDIQPAGHLRYYLGALISLLFHHSQHAYSTIRLLSSPHSIIAAPNLPKQFKVSAMPAFVGAIRDEAQRCTPSRSSQVTDVHWQV